MRVKRFQGRDSAAALQAVRREFGDDAVILETIRLEDDGAGTEGVEIVAAVDFDPVIRVVRETRAVPQPPPETTVPEVVESLDGAGEKAGQIFWFGDESEVETEEIPGVSERTGEHPEYDLLRCEMKQLKAMMFRLLSGSGLIEEWSQPVFNELFEALRARKVSSEIAFELLREVQGEVAGQVHADRPERWVAALVKAALARRLQERVEILEPVALARVVTLVGPTGVGKTTTLAKLAAYFMGRAERVALVSVDTFRLGAVEQIREYGRRLEIPVEIVENRRQLSVVLGKFADFDRVLIDTIGRGSRDRSGLAALLRILRGLSGDTLLVLPAALQEEDLLENLVSFRSFGARALLFTKLDETSCHGSLLNGLTYARLPLSFFTHGQKVPEDIEIASPERLVDLLLDIVKEAENQELFQGRI
ncbi:MAG: flagellar biosynthesis protein FlhF [Deltaproteobacteria bacterium]|nr:flagellar biosynthesis protein FlhF [Deltaproteobacteria bacterium]